MYPGLWFSRMLQQYTGIAAQSQYSSCSINGITIQIYCSKSHYWSLNACCHDTVFSQLLGRDMQVSPIVVYFLYFILGWVTYTLPSHVGLVSSGKHYSWLIVSGKAVHLILELNDASVFLKQSFLSSPSCAEIISALFMTIHCFSLHSSLSTSFLPISSGHSSIAGVSTHSHIFQESHTCILQKKVNSFFYFQKGRNFQGWYFFCIKRKGPCSWLKKSLDFHLYLQVCDNNHSWEKEALDIYFHKSVQISCPFLMWFCFLFFFFFILCW